MSSLPFIHYISHQSLIHSQQWLEKLWQNKSGPGKDEELELLFQVQLLMSLWTHTFYLKTYKLNVFFCFHIGYAVSVILFEIWEVWTGNKLSQHVLCFSVSLESLDSIYLVLYTDSIHSLSSTKVIQHLQLIRFLSQLHLAEFQPPNVFHILYSVCRLHPQLAIAVHI